MELTAQKREIFGKKASVLRKQGFVPAELYGHGLDNMHLMVPAKDFSKVFKEAGESTLIKLKINPPDGGNEFNVLVHDFQKNHLTDEFSHIDFYSVRMDEKITTSVPLEFIGEAPAVKEMGGILVKAMHEVEIEALPADLPHHINVDISSIKEIGGSIFIKDLNFGKGVKILVEPETVVATVTELAKEEEIKPEVKVEDIKIEGEEKKKEREREKEKEKESEQ
ncbi:MAG: 50S ribosomal protein L25 [Patescibacteria group bacterium]